jgi:hypothetical protein
MRWFFRLLRFVLGLNVVILIVIVALRLLPLPTSMQVLGFDRCDGMPCLNRSLNVQDFIDKRTTLGWVIAWLGTPCRAQPRSGAIILTYPSAEVYAYNMRTGDGRIVVSEQLWGVEVNRKQQAKLCNNDLGLEPWKGFDSNTSISAGALQ